MVLCAVILLLYEAGYLISYGEWPRAFSFNTNPIALGDIPWLDDWAGFTLISIRVPISALMFWIGIGIVGITHLLQHIVLRPEK